MPKSRPYAPEFCPQVVEMVRAGRTTEELAEEFEPTATAIRNWVAQTDVETGRRTDELLSGERAQISRPRREVRALREEREIQRRAAAWFARETVPSPRGSTS